MGVLTPRCEMARIIDIITLADEIGVSGESWFVEEVEKLSFRFDSLRYKKLLERCLSVKNFPSLLNQIFRKPVMDSDMEELRGEYAIGTVMDSDIEVGLSRKALGLHTLISGATGFGKTNTLNALSESIQQQGGIIEYKIDVKTNMRDFRYQVRKYPNVIVIPLSELCLNPFGMITGVPRRALMQQIIDVLSGSFTVYDASQGVIAEHMEKIFEREEQPCFMDLEASILSERAKGYGRMQGYLDTLKSRFGNTRPSLSKTFGYRKDYFNELLASKKSVIFEVGGMPDVALNVLVPLLIMKLSLYKTYSATNYLEFLLYFEESQGAILSKNLEQRNRTPTVAGLATGCRSYGMGLVALCQNPATKIITEMVSNSANLITHHLGGTEVRGMMDCMGLTFEQKDLLQHLQPGEAIFKTSFGYTEPLLVQVRQIDNTPPSNDQIEQLMRPIWDELHSFVTPVNQAKTVPVEQKSEDKKPIAPSQDQQVTSTLKASALSPDDEILLRDIQLRPYEFTENRYKQSTLTRNRAIRSKEKLCRLGYLDEKKIKNGKQGKPPSMLRLTEKAIALLGIPATQGKGSSEHQWWQHFVLSLARNGNGLKAKIEDSLADVSISNGKVNLGIEISLSDSNVVRNADRDFQNGFSEVWFAVPDKAMLDKVKEHLASRILKPGKIEILLLEELALEIRKRFSNG